MTGYRAVAAAAALLMMTGAGCSAGIPSQVAPGRARSARSATPTQLRVCSSVPAAQHSESAPWTSRIVLRENTVQSISDQLVDPAAAEVFLLVSATNSPVRGPWVLCRIGLPAGTVRQGPTFAAGGLIAASGDLWVYGAAAPGSRPVVIQVNPVTLRRIRLIRLPRLPAGFGGLPATLT